MSTRGRPRALRPWTGGLTCLAAIAGLVACSNGDDGELNLGDATTLAPTSSPTTASPPTTTAPTTTAPATTTTEPAAATTTEPLDVEAQIRADFARSVVLRTECGYRPDACEFVRIAVPGSQYDRGLQEQMAGRVANGLRSKPGEGSFEYVIEALVVDGDTALITICGIDSIVIFDIRDPDDPSDDVVFDETTVSSRTDWTLARTEAGWLRSAGDTTAEIVGTGLCDAS